MKTAILWKLSMGVSAVLLAACGSSGSAIVVPNHASGSSSHGKTATTTSGGTQTVKPVSNSAEWGGVVVGAKTDTKADKFTEFGKTDSLSGSGLDKVTINGKEVTLLEKSENKWVRVDNPNLQSIIHGGYQYTRFGLHELKANNTEYMNVIAHGQLTPAADVPTTGTAKYTGHALYADDKVDWAEGTSAFNVDFGAKTITGNVTIPTANKNIGLAGNIDGNSFAGTKSGVQMQGHFFGPKAEELSGTFHKGNTANPGLVGAFGAKK